jgi:hypothetical protein
MADPKVVIDDGLLQTISAKGLSSSVATSRCKFAGATIPDLYAFAEGLRQANPDLQFDTDTAQSSPTTLCVLKAGGLKGNVTFYKTGTVVFASEHARYHQNEAAMRKLVTPEVKAAIKAAIEAGIPAK